jgi:redox-sensitive bicupin YhaK (pirin superfamily)
VTAVEVRRAADRAVTRTSWLDSRHSFSYGSHYDPANTHFGLLLACNEDRLAAGAGFGEHPHRDVEVVTWVLSGALRHTDDSGHRGEATPGVLQRMSAGAGVRHAERAGAAGAHYVQMWLRPAAAGGEPAYDTVSVGTDPGLVEVVPLRQPAATLHAGRLPPGGSATLPPAEYLHVLVVVGAVELTGRPAGPPEAAGAVRTVELAGQSLGTGDAVRLTGAGPVELRTEAGAEVIAWGMRAGLSVG